MRFSWLILLCFLCPAAAIAQLGIITGKVVNKDSKNPIARASVFLSNSSFGTITSNDGNFILSNLKPGQYTLVVTTLGYADHIETVLITGELIKLTIELEPKAIELRAVNIAGSKSDWQRNYQQFKREFIGTDDNAKYCEVVNPSILNFDYYTTQKRLEASADEFLVVNNTALGYRVKFLLHSFTSDHINDTISYQGQQLFEELPGTAAQKKKWKINRDLAYYGSPMHFYRALYTDKLKEEGFEARKFSRILNPERPQEEEIQKMIPMFISKHMIDSAKHWIELEKLSKYSHEHLSATPWFSFEILRTTQMKGIYALTFPDLLYVIYTKKREEIPFKDIYQPLDMPNYEVSILTPHRGEEYIYFDKNGIIVDHSPMYEGTWNKSRLSQLLPVDYTPSDKQ